MGNDILASVDLGSNSFRLLIVRIREDGTLRPIDQLKETVRLASGIDENGYLTEQVQQVALAALARFSERLLGLSSNQVRAVGTSSLRIARNSSEFIAKANQVLGFPIEVISGLEEARLIYNGAIHSMAYSEDNRLVVDIGGGSTEFIIGKGLVPIVMESVTMGCVSYSSKYFPNGELTENNFSNAILAARSKIQPMEHLFIGHSWVEAVGTSGSAHALYEACLVNQSDNSITLNGLEKLKKLLIKAGNVDRISIKGLKNDRYPVIAGGVSIMLAIFEEFSINHMTIADGSLREGVAYDMLGRQEKRDLRYLTVKDLLKRYNIDIEQSNRVAEVTKLLFQELSDGASIDKNKLKLLYWAASLYEIGLSISHNDYHKHGSYILANSDLAGFSKPEQLVIAELVRGHRGQLFRVFDRLKSSNQNELQICSYLELLAFRLSVILNRNRKDVDYNQYIRISLCGVKHFCLDVDKNWLLTNPLTNYSIEEEINQWKECGYELILNKL